MLDIIKNGKGKILNLFFKDVDREYYLREIAKILKKEPGHFQVSLNSLVEEGILVDERKGNLRFFKLNKDYHLYEELKKIISKTLGVEVKLKDLVNKLDNIQYAFIFGSIAKNEEHSESDIDLMLIGYADADYLSKEINELHRELGREINYHLFSIEEVKDRISNGDNFLNRILNNPLIILKGKPDEIRRGAQ
ncbi:MAG: nucleotidyltransferase domain-containing protein [Patescibacteria group bacterium]